MHGRGIDRFDSNDAHLRTQIFHVGTDASGQTATTDWNKNNVKILRMLSANFNSDRTLPGNGIRVVKGVDKRVALFLAEYLCVL